MHIRLVLSNVLLKVQNITFIKVIIFAYLLKLSPGCETDNL